MIRSTDSSDPTKVRSEIPPENFVAVTSEEVFQDSEKVEKKKFLSVPNVIKLFLSEFRQSEIPTIIKNLKSSRKLYCSISTSFLV